jgi:peptide/nickel transport system substrate-binding protein/microcin C transport system substrate-binding protein
MQAVLSGGASAHTWRRPARAARAQIAYPKIFEVLRWRVWQTICVIAAQFTIVAPLGAQPVPQPLPLAAVTPGGSSLPVRWSHAYASFGEPKYLSGFVHFDYVNPDAPKGGTLYLRNPDRRTNFDKFNDFTLQGNAPAGLTLLMLESLAVRSADELQTMYGLLAEAMSVAPDK